MTSAVRRVGKAFVWLTAAVIAVAVGGELILAALEEAAAVLIQASQAILIRIFERGFDIPYAKAEGLAAWTALGLAALLAILAFWKLRPWVRSKVAAAAQWCRTTRSVLIERWRRARWYQKSGVVIAGLILLFGLMMVI